MCAFNAAELDEIQSLADACGKSRNDTLVEACAAKRRELWIIATGASLWQAEGKWGVRYLRDGTWCELSLHARDYIDAVGLAMRHAAQR